MAPELCKPQCQTATIRSPDGAERNPGTIRKLQCPSRITLRSIRATKKKGSGTPADAVVQVPHASGVRGAPRIKSACADPSAVGRARLPAFHHGSRQRESSSLRLSLGQASWDSAGALDPVRPPQPGGGDLAQLKRALHPPRPVPVQRSTSRAGRNAGRLDAQAARERTANPPAGTALAPTVRCASARRPYGRDLIRIVYR